MQLYFKYLLFLCILIHISNNTTAQEDWNKLPVKGLLLSAPRTADIPLFCRFIREALPKEGVNTLAIRFEYAYLYKSHPELAGDYTLSREDVKQIVAACKAAKVRLIPTMNLLGHQSEQTEMLPLLKHYPQLDESPDYNPPVPWKDAGMFDFYSKSVCPEHPDLLKIFFPMMDELVEVCEADALHVGLDEVWIMGYDKCPRCGGRDKAELFAAYVNKLYNHLKAKNCQMWMWSDRLIDGKTTGLLAWQASMNNTHRAIDMIPKDIMITDWKYEDAAPTATYFAIKGFDVLASPCGNTDAALAQLKQVYLVRNNGARTSFSGTISGRMKGVFETSWIAPREFIEAYYGKTGYKQGVYDNVNTFKKLFAEIRKTEK